jgi:hypothetical protein
VKVPRPAIQILGIPPIKKFAILPDRRYILTQDAEGLVEMWDVTSASSIRSFGKQVGFFSWVSLGILLTIRSS